MARFRRNEAYSIVQLIVVEILRQKLPKAFSQAVLSVYTIVDALTAAAQSMNIASVKPDIANFHMFISLFGKLFRFTRALPSFRATGAPTSSSSLGQLRPGLPVRCRAKANPNLTIRRLIPSRPLLCKTCKQNSLGLSPQETRSTPYGDWGHE